MVRLWPDGGRLSPDLAARAAEAARRHAAGDVPGAVALCRAILAVDLRQPDALYLMGLVAFQSGNAALGLQLIESAIAARPDFAAAWHDHGHILYVQSRFAEAARSARAAVESAPDLAAAWDLLARALAAQGGSAAEVAVCHTRAAALAPADAKILGNYAAFLFGRGALAQACRVATQAEQSDADWPPMVLGNILKAMGYPELAARRFARARNLCPDIAEVAASEAAARLQIGDWERGWDLWALRPDLDQSMAQLPLWRGERGKRIILYEDQGMGDALQFARLIPFALKQAGSVAALRLRAPLCRLMAEAFPSLPIIDEDAPLPQAEARARLSDLPTLARARIDTIPAAPYLTADGARRAAWREKLAALPGPRVGLIHAGNPRFRNDAARSIAAEHVTPLFDCGASIVHLQTDRPATLPGFDAAPFLHDFADTAALMAELDLVITVDTAGAHLAGALGAPVFIMIAFDNDWRWLVGREDSPWYPSARLFRQTRPGDWRGVIAAVAADLRRLVAGDRAVLRAAAGPQSCLPVNPYALALPS